MLKISDVLHKYEIKPLRYYKKNKICIVDTDSDRYVLKEGKYNPIFTYLNSRNFNYYPEVLSDNNDDFIITKYIEEVDMPLTQKMTDLVDLVSLLHNKTTHYKEVDEGDYKEIYEDIKNNIDYLFSYYNDTMTIIESRVFMSPSEYLLARNISKIYDALGYCKYEIDTWYNIVKEKRKQRMVVLHNNLNMSHFIRSDQPYLISWDKSKIDMPIFDLYKLFLNHGLEYDFADIMKRYEKEYPLLKEERILLFILMSLPSKIEFNKSEYIMCQNISKEVERLYRTEKIISPYYSKDSPEDKNPKKE